MEAIPREGRQATTRPHGDLVADPSLRDSADVVASFGSDARVGLTGTGAAERLSRVGPNRLRPARRLPAWRRFAAQFQNPLIYLLLGGIVVSLLAWAVEGAAGVPIEACVIAAIVLANGVLGFVQEQQAEQAVAALQRMAAPAARVVRDGDECRIDAELVVPGDILVLREGDAVTADARLVEADALTVAEAPLTGESEPVPKSPLKLASPVAVADRSNMVFSGTAVSRGRALAVVTATGMSTEIGGIAELLGQTPDEKTPLQVEIDHVGRMLAAGVVLIAIVVVAAVLLTAEIRGPSDLVDALLLGVSLAVAAVPEGLPAILTVVLALGVQRMARQHAIVKQLASVETLGSASAICSDKTGTLTRNEMTIERIVTHSGEVMVTGSGYAPVGNVLVEELPLARGPLWSEVRAVLGGGGAASDAVLENRGDTWTIIGDPTEAAFLVAERKLGTGTRRIGRFERRAVIPFTSERKLMSAIVADTERDGRSSIMTKGAPGAVLERCTRERIGTTDEPLSDARRAAILAAVDRFADASLRTLAVAYRPLAAAEAAPAGDEIERELVFAGVVGMLDAARPEVPAAIGEARRAGIRVVMITGDHARTATRVATDLGILDPGTDTELAVLGARQIEGMDDEALRSAARHASVYARVSPEHKLRIVRALRAGGQVVAMTGDGVNDAPALKAADIGVAMGITGTDVAKEAANMILADDNFATIVVAVREGRGIFANIRKFLHYLLSSNVGEVLTIFVGVMAAPVLGLDLPTGTVAPLLATQILWINLLTDAAPALALGFEPVPADVMRRPPRRPTDRVIDRSMWARVLYIGGVMAAVTLLAIDARLPGGLVAGSGTIDEARTMGFTILVLAQLFNALNARSSHDSALRHPLGNRTLVGAIALSAMLQLLVVQVPAMNSAFGTVPLTAGDWLACIAIASVVLWADELRKLVVRVR